MGRKRKTQVEQVQQEQEQSNEVVTEVNTDVTKTDEQVQNKEVVKETAKPTNTTNTTVNVEVVKSEHQEIDDTEKLISRISILEHMFDKKVIERGIYDVYQKGNMWIFKDRNGREISTHYGELENALKMFIIRMNPLDRRTKGSTFTWSELDQ